MDTFVKLENITKIYHMGEVEIRAVDGIDFSIQKGEFVVIVGPSGAGKTTVLNILGGMDTASGGRITVDGQDITKYSERQLMSSVENARPNKSASNVNPLERSVSVPVLIASFAREIA